jgi:hypothetical protein
MKIERRGDDGAPVSGIAWNAQALDENGNTQDVAIRETGLGRYEARIPLGTRKHLSLRMHDRDHDKLDVKHYHAPYPAEYRLNGKTPDSMLALLRYEPPAIVAGLAPVAQLKPVGHWFAWSALLALLGGVLLRRI